VVTANLVNPESDTVLFGRVLKFRNCHRDAVDQEDDIGAVAKDDALLPPFVGDLEQVVFGVFEVDDFDVAFPIFIGDEDRLFSSQPRVGFPVSLDAGVEQIHTPKYVRSPTEVNDARIKTNKLGFKDSAEI
jgi:hypothetical protein